MTGTHLAITLSGQDSDWYAESATKMCTLIGGTPDIDFQTDRNGNATGFDFAPDGSACHASAEVSVSHARHLYPRKLQTKTVSGE